MKAALITGASGFIGKHLCRYLCSRGVAVTALDLLPSNIDDNSGHEFVQADIVTGQGLDALSSRHFDVIYHLAASGVKAPSREWPACVKVNILGTLNLLQRFCYGVHRPIFVYTHTFYEDYLQSIPIMSENPYVLSKLAMTQILRTFAPDYKGRIVLAKLYQIYGQGDATNNLLPYVVSSLMKNGPVLLGSGEGLRDWLHVDDLVVALEVCWHAGEAMGIEEYDIGSGELHSIKEVVQKVAELMNKSVSLLQFDKSRDRNDLTANGKAENTPRGWQPRIDLVQGLSRLISETNS